jgi:mono/diheme cytochrome c family protein
VRKEVAHDRLLTGGAAAHMLTDGPVVQRGRMLVNQAACRRCHTIGGTGNTDAIVLDAVAWSRSQAHLAGALEQPVDGMPAFHFDRRQVEAVIAHLLEHRSPAPQETYRVRFTTSLPARRSLFEEQCGGCHRRLGPSGGAGHGTAGPNLSGLWTPFYPPTAPGDQPWSPEALRRWLANPRATRPATTMPPVSLDDAQFASLLDETGRTSGGSDRAPSPPMAPRRALNR